MDWSPLPLGSTVAAHDAQARACLDALQAGEAQAIAFFRQWHPRFRRDDVPWLPRHVDDATVRQAGFVHDDARLALARAYDFADWISLVAIADAMRDPISPIARFERAVEAVVDGDLQSLGRLLREEPGLARARSTRVTPFDPPTHRATLLHYVAANGVEGHRQRTPANAVEVARLLLDAGADPDAVADMYGGRCTTMSLLVSSDHPAKAGLQVPLVDLLVDYGASVEATGDGAWTSPLMTALAFGFVDAARALVRRGARVDTLAAAAGLGDLEVVQRRLPTADQDDRHRALAMAANLGHADVLGELLDAGEDPDRYNPPNAHAHATPLHSAVASNHLDVVRLLVERGARLDRRDAIYDATPQDWAEYLGRTAIAEYLRAARAE
jgi:ankyrin repeat protein